MKLRIGLGAVSLHYFISWKSDVRRLYSFPPLPKFCFITKFDFTPHTHTHTHCLSLFLFGFHQTLKQNIRWETKAERGSLIQHSKDVN